MNILPVISIGFLISFFGFYLRVIKKDQGADSWYYMASLRELKKRKKIPIKLPYYILDKEEQWYPPGFIVFLSIFSFNFLKKYQGIINPLVDSLQLIFLYFFTYFITGDILTAILAGLIYAITFTLIVENSNLNPRGLSSFLFTLTLIFLYHFFSSQNLWWLVTVLIFSFFLLMTHKLATQVLVFLLVGLALIFYNWQYLMILGLIFLIALIFSKGFYLKVLKGHKEILMFWKKNLANLRVHQIFHSPIYEKDNKKSPLPFHQKGIKGFLVHTKRLIGHNPWIVFIVFLPPLLTKDFSLINFLFWWLVLTYFLIILTTYFPPLRFFGEGYKYIKFAIFPQSFLIANLIITNNSFSWLFLVIVLINLYAIFKIFKPAYKIKEKTLKEIIDFLKNQPQNKEGGVMCLPVEFSDLIAFFTQRKVLWGGHSSDWDRFGEFCPVFRKPIEYFFEKYNLNFLLLEKDFAEVKDLKLTSAFKKVLENNKFFLFGYKKNDG